MAITTMKSKSAAAELRDWPLMKNNIARADLDAVIKFLQQDDPILTQSRNVSRLRTGMVGMARREAQRLRQFRLVGQPDHDGRHPRTLWRRRNHRADADMDFRHRVRFAKRLRPRVRGHQPAHAGDGHQTGGRQNFKKDARGFSHAHSWLQRAGRLSAGGIEEAQHPAH